MRRPIRLLALLVAVLAHALPAGAASGPKSSDVLLPRDFTPVTDAEKALTSVPSAPGAPAVVLFEGAQYEWESVSSRWHYHRRLKVLTEAGVHEHGDFEYDLFGDWRVKEVKARTILPDGTVVDAKDDIHRDKSKDLDLEVIRVTFPRVAVGAILDFFVSVTSDELAVSPWVIQGQLPVRESRLVLLPPTGLSYRTAAIHLPPESNKPLSFRLPTGMAIAWVFRDVPPLPALPNLPPAADIAQQLLVIVESYHDESASIPIASDWKSWCRARMDEWDQWMRHKNQAAESLAKQVTEGKATPREKAEAIRLALRDRVRAGWRSRFAAHDNPDEALTAGTGTTGELAALTAAMLRAVGVPAKLAAYRPRSMGVIARDVPLPTRLEDLLVVLPGEGAAGANLYYSPAADLPVGSLPADARGVLAVPYDKNVETPVPIPDLTADENRVEHAIQAALAIDGKLTAQSTTTLHGAAAVGARRLLKSLDAAKRKEQLGTALRASVPGADLKDVLIENLDDESKDLIITTEWEAEGYASRAGNRLVLNPLIEDRSSSADWAQEKRTLPIELGNAREQVATVMLRLPQGLESVRLPGNANFSAAPAGAYEASFDVKEDTVIAKRKLRLDLHSFPADSYPALRQWFLDVATADDQSLVLTIAAP